MYESLEAFLRDLPAHAEKHRQELMGHDMCVVLQTKQGRKLALQLKDGGISFVQNDMKADCTVTADERDLLDMINGKLNPMKALLFRKITIQGDVAKLMALIKLV